MFNTNRFNQYVFNKIVILDIKPEVMACYARFVTPTLIAITPPLILVDGVDLEKLGCTLLWDSRRSLAPGRKLRRIEVPGRHGSIVIGGKSSQRLLELSLAIHQGGLENYAKAKQDLALLLGKETREFCFGDDPGRVYYGRYAGQTSLEEWIEDGLVTIPITLVDPYIYSRETSFTGPGEIRNLGTEATNLIVEVTGPIEDPQITIGDKTLKFLGGLNEEETLTIDGINFTVSLDSTNVLPLFDGDIPLIPPGTIFVSCSSENVVWRWRNRWLI